MRLDESLFVMPADSNSDDDDDSAFYDALETL